MIEISQYLFYRLTRFVNNIKFYNDNTIRITPINYHNIVNHK